MTSSSGLMLMLLLGFVGILVMFLFLMRSLAAQQALLRENAARHEALLVDLEGRLKETLHLLRKGAGPADSAGAAQPPAELSDLLEGASKLPSLDAPFAPPGRPAGGRGSLDLKLDPR